MSNGYVALAVVAGIVGIPAMIWVGTYNGLNRKELNISKTDREVVSCYQKRADLLSNLEATVNRYANHEKDTQLGVAERRAGAGQVKVPENATPEQLAEAQKLASSVFSRLMAVAEATPDLKANVNFLLLQKDLKQTETQCSILRKRQIEAINTFNLSLRTFPSNIIANTHGFTEKKQLEFDNEQDLKKSPRLFQSK